ncbi:MAG: hypothetical protein QNJ38_04940 [Prochloraceae cyanobacterium]|nr:hypothetical protein [Prochloraceae cyanobacterium]
MKILATTYQAFKLAAVAFSLTIFSTSYGIAQPIQTDESVQLDLVKRIKIAKTRTELLSLLPQTMHPCISSQVTGGKLWSTFRSTEATYYLIGLFLGNDYYNYTEAIVEIKSRNCQILTPLSSEEPFSYLSYLNEEIVIPLLVDKYQKEITELGGIDNFKKRHLSHFGDPSWEHYITTEKLKAYARLGIEIPSETNVFVISPYGIFPYVSSPER